MSYSIAIISDMDLPRQYVEGIERAVRPNLEMHREISAEAVVIVKQRFAEKGNEPNQHNWPSTGFWQRMIGGTIPLADEESAGVRMPREVAQRFFGGTITPVDNEYLAIPAREEAYGMSPLQFNDLRFVPFASGSAALVQRNQQTVGTFKSGKKKGERNPKTTGEKIGGGVFYWLVKSVTQRPDETVLPTEEEFTAAARRGINTYMDRMGLS